MQTGILNWTSWASNEANYGYSAAGPFQMIDKSLYDQFNDEDWRKLSFVAPEDGELNGQEPFIEKDNRGYLPAYASLKFRPGFANTNDYNVGSAVAIPLMRIEEMWFIYAEAAAHNNANAGKEILENFMKEYRYDTYSCPIEYLGQFVSPAGDSKISASVGFGANTAAVRLGVTKGSNATALIAALTEGSDPNMVEIARRDADHSGSFDIIAGGQYTFAAVSMDKNGEVKESSTLSVYVNLFGDDAAWNDLGEGVMADGWVIGAVFGFDPLDHAFPVNIQESKKQPKLYRVVDPYHSAQYPAPNACKAKADIYIDLSDTEVIPVFPQFSGWGDYEVQDGKYLGDMYIANLEGALMDLNGYTKEEILEVDPETGANYVATIFEDDVLVMNMPFFNLTGNLIPNNWYYGESASCILFPGSDDAEPAAKIKAAKARKVTTKPSVKFASRFEIKSNLNRIDESARRR